MYETKIEENPKAKRKRVDVSQKKKDRVGKQQRVIKCFLSSTLSHPIFFGKCHLIDLIKKRVDAFSKRQVIASISLNYLIKELFQKASLEEINGVEIPNILDQTFIRQLLLGTDGCQKPIATITTFYSNHPELFDKIKAIPRHEEDRNIYSSGAKRFVTNLANHFHMNFKNRVNKFIYSNYVQDYLYHQWINKQTGSRAILYEIMNWKKLPGDQKIIEQLPEDVLRYIKLQKEILGTDNIDDEWLKNKENISKLLRYSIFISRFLEDPYNIENPSKHKQFNILPLSTPKNHYISIDTHSLFGLFKEANLINCTREDFLALRFEQWQTILNFNKLRGKHDTFTGTIETDGIGLSVHFERLKKPTEFNSKTTFDDYIKSLKPDLLEYWGIDPGREIIMQATKRDEFGNIETIRLGRKQYYAESGIYKANEMTNKWHKTKTMKKILKDLSENSPKGNKLDTFEKYVHKMLLHWDDQWKEYGHSKYSKQRMLLYGGKKKVFAEFFNKMQTDGKITIVGYGSAKFASGGKGEISVPTCRAYKECSNRYLTRPIEEFRTTKVFHGDKETILTSVKRRDNGKVVRGLLWCCSTSNSKSKLINRDLNASINILDCLVAYPERPIGLSRTGDKKALQNTIGRTIKC